MPTKSQHYVWREYLRGWSNNDQIYCLVNNKIINTNLMNIGQENYFYRLYELSLDDIQLIRDAFISNQPEPLIKNNEGWIKLLTFIFELKKYVLANHIESPQIIEFINTQINTFGEDIHSGIESIGIPIIKKLYTFDDSVFLDNSTYARFCYFISTQYFRTKKMQSNITEQVLVSPFLDFSKCWNVCSHIFATTVGFGLYKEKNIFDFIFLRNKSSLSFITGDQPVINSLADYTTPKILSDKEFELYYPLKPDLALLLTQNKEKYSHIHDVEVEEVENYNRLIFEASEKQIYANSSFELDTYLKREN